MRSPVPACKGVQESFCLSAGFVLLLAGAGAVYGSGPIAAGESHSLRVGPDGRVWAWGSNSQGQLGIGTIGDRYQPTVIPGLTGVVAIEAGASHSLALKADGTVWSWGSNLYGKLGDGTTTNRSTPVQVNGLTGIVAIAGGYNHTLALKSDGTVWAWGQNFFGELGDKTTSDRSSPVQVTQLTGVAGIAAGQYYSVFLKNDGTVWNSGFGAFSASLGTPTLLTGFTGITAIALGYDHILALTSDGTVLARGRNNYGQLGDGTKTDSSFSPVPVTGLVGVTAIEAGNGHSIALKNNGTVWTWGRNSMGQLGLGTTENTSLPRMVPALSGAAAVAGGGSHTLVLKNDGTLEAFGSDLSGQLGTGRLQQLTTPTAVPNLTMVQTVDSGGSHTLALKNDGTVWAWGSNSFGQLGDGTNAHQSAPVQVSGLAAVSRITAGGGRSVAVKNDGTVWQWGDIDYCRSGIPPLLIPTQVSGLTGVIAASNGYLHTLVLKSDGTVWAWGSNSDGQLGRGTTGCDPTPVIVPGLNGVTAIAAGLFHSLALLNDGRVRAWGDNFWGQLGDTTDTDRLTPITVSGLTNVRAIAGGRRHSAAVRNDGSVWTWGANDVQQLGVSTTSNWSPVPLSLNTLPTVDLITAGYDHNLARTSTGIIYSWGKNASGQLGDGTTTNRLTPVIIDGLTGVTGLAGSADHSVALKGDGTLMSWGSNEVGQLGAGTPLLRSTPVSVRLDGSAPAEMVSPLKGSVLPGSSVLFEWTAGTGIDQYWLSVSKLGVGGAELYNASQGANLSRTVTGLPRNSSPVYVRLYSHTASGVWLSADYVYTAAATVLPAMTSPANGSKLPGASAVFQWGTGTDVDEYWLSVSKTGVGAFELYNGSQGTSLSRTVSGLPVDGSTIYVRLHWHVSGGAWAAADYVYSAAGGSALAAITTPANRSTLAGSSVTFQWTAGAAIDQYWLSVGKSGIGSFDLYNSSQGTNLARTVTGLPADGSTIYVRLYSHLAGGAWGSADYTYTAAGPAVGAITTPANGSTLAGSSVTFQWSAGTGIAEYWLSVSKIGVGAFELYNGSQGASLSRTLTGLPTDGSTIYVRLYSHAAGGAWVSRDYTYTAAGGSGLASMISPSNGSTLAGSSVTFQWTAGTGNDEYWLSVSKIGAGAFELYNGSQGASLSRTVSGLPVDGSTVYVRLYSHVAGGSWLSRDYNYTAAGAGALAAITSPANGSTLTGSSVTFQWNTGTGIDQYWLSVSKVGVGGFELYNGSQGTNTSRTVTGLPTNGSTVYVRLHSHVIGGAWQSRDYAYSAGP